MQFGTIDGWFKTTAQHIKSQNIQIKYSLTILAKYWLHMFAIPKQIAADNSEKMV